MGLAPTVGGTFVNPEYSGLINSGSSMWDKISPYANVQNLSGAANIYNQFNKPTPRPQAQSSGLKQAQIPQGTDVMELLKAIKIPEKKHITLL
jgi:hypothetical protein